MFAFERRWACAVFDAILPRGVDERLPLGARDFPLDRLVVDLERRAPLQFLIGLRLAIWLMIFCPIWVLGRPRRFHRLAVDAQQRCLDKVGNSRIYLLRETLMLLKMVACLGYGGMPIVQQQLGISPTDATDPDWVVEGVDA